MPSAQKDRHIQYLAEQNQNLWLAGEAIKLVLEDYDRDEGSEGADGFIQSKHSDLAEELSEERKLRKSAECRAQSL